MAARKVMLWSPDKFSCDLQISSLWRPHKLTQIKKVLSPLGVPGVSHKTLKRQEREILATLKTIADKSCLDTIEEEKSISGYVNDKDTAYIYLFKNPLDQNTSKAVWQYTSFNWKCFLHNLSLMFIKLNYLVHVPREGPGGGGVKLRMCPPYPQRVVKGD